MGSGCTLLLNKAKIDTSKRQNCKLVTGFHLWWMMRRGAVTSTGLGRRSEDHPSLWCSPHTQHRSCERERLFLSITVVPHSCHVQMLSQGPFLPPLDDPLLSQRLFSTDLPTISGQACPCPVTSEGTHPLLPGCDAPGSPWPIKESLSLW